MSCSPLACQSDDVGVGDTEGRVKEVFKYTKEHLGIVASGLPSILAIVSWVSVARLVRMTPSFLYTLL